MSGVTLEDYMDRRINRLSRYHTVVISSLGIKFPQLYRVTIPDTPLVLPMYVLDPERKVYKDAVSTPIKTMDPAVDNGIVFIRHHSDEQFARGYGDALFDRFLGSERAITECGITQTDQGFFTVQHREPSPGAENHLIVYACTLSREFKEGQDTDEYQIVFPDGDIVLNADALYGTEDDE